MIVETDIDTVILKRQISVGRFLHVHSDVSKNTSNLRANGKEVGGGMKKIGGEGDRGEKSKNSQNTEVVDTEDCTPFFAYDRSFVRHLSYFTMHIDRRCDTSLKLFIGLAHFAFR